MIILVKKKLMEVCFWILCSQKIPVKKGPRWKSPRKLIEGSWTICKFLSLNPTRRPPTQQKMLNAHLTIPHTPNWETGVREPFFQVTIFPGDFLSWDFFSRGPIFGNLFLGFLPLTILKLPVATLLIIWIRIWIWDVAFSG